MRATLVEATQRPPGARKPLRRATALRFTGGMTWSPRLPALAVSAVLAAGLTTLAGCGDGGATTIRTHADTAAQDPAGSSAAPAGSDADQNAVETDDGTVTAGKAVPDGFPRDAVPLIDATVVTGARGVPGGHFAWSVVMQTPRAVDDVTAEVRKDFAADGYTVGQVNEMGDVTMLQFRSHRYVVGVTAARTGDRITVTYLVKNAG